MCPRFGFYFRLMTLAKEAQAGLSIRALRPPFRFITRVAPHCDNTLMIQHAAHKTRFHRAKLSPGIGEHILAEIDAESLHLGEEAVHLRRRGVVVHGHAGGGRARRGGARGISLAAASMYTPSLRNK